MKKFIFTLLVVGGVLSFTMQAWARSTSSPAVISYIAPVYWSGYNSTGALNMDGGDEYIIIQSEGGGYSSCGGSMWSGYAYVRPDHPNKHELYTLFLTSKAMNQPVTCTYETSHTDDYGGCIIVYCSL